MDKAQERAAGKALLEAAKAVGSKRKLGLALGLSEAAALQWKWVPAERVHDVERITGIERSRLRPDLYPVERERKR